MDKTTTERIKADAEAYVEKTRGQQGRVETYIAGATAVHAYGFYDALMELLELKELKDKHGKTPEYLRRQPIAWQRAKEIMNQWKDGKKEVCTCDNIQLAAHGECWGCPGRHTREKEDDDTCRCILPNWNAFTGKCLTCGKQ